MRFGKLNYVAKQNLNYVEGELTSEQVYFDNISYSIF